MTRDKSRFREAKRKEVGEEGREEVGGCGWWTLEEDKRTMWPKENVNEEEEDEVEEREEDEEGQKQV